MRARVRDRKSTNANGGGMIRVRLDSFPNVYAYTARDVYTVRLRSRRSFEGVGRAIVFAERQNVRPY